MALLTWLIYWNNTHLRYKEKKSLDVVARNLCSPFRKQLRVSIFSLNLFPINIFRRIIPSTSFLQDWMIIINASNGRQMGMHEPWPAQLFKHNWPFCMANQKGVPYTFSKFMYNFSQMTQSLTLCHPITTVEILTLPEEYRIFNPMIVRRLHFLFYFSYETMYCITPKKYMWLPYNHRIKFLDATSMLRSN